MSIVYFTAGWLAGIWLAPRLSLPQPLWIGVLVLSTILLWAWRREPGTMARVCLILWAAALGALRELAVPTVLDAGHVAMHNGAEAVTVYGVVGREPIVRDRSVDLPLRVDTVRLADGTELPAHGWVLLTTARLPEIPYGARLSATGALAAPPTNPEFDYRAYLARRDIHSQMAFPRVVVLGQAGNPWRLRLLAFKQHAQAALLIAVAEPQAGLLNAMLFGDDSALSSMTQDAFRTAGLAHLLVVSGFHVALLAATLQRLLGAWLPRRAAVGVTLLCLALYAALIGGTPAVVRAVLMIGVYLTTTQLLGRTAFGLGSLALAALCLTLVRPQLVEEVGFQLSFAATLALIVYVEPVDSWVGERLARHLNRRWQTAAEPVRQLVVASLAAQTVTLPLVLYHFGRISLVALPANLLLVPVQPLALTLGGAATLAGAAVEPLGRFIGWLAWPFLAYTYHLTHRLADLPFAAADMTLTAGGVAGLYLALGGLTWLARQPGERRTAWRAAWRAALRPDRPLRVAYPVLLLAAILAFSWARTQPDGKLHLVFIDVGQGDAVWLQSPSGRQIVIDAGYYPSAIGDAVGRLMPFWDRSLDMVIATHADADHVTGIPTLFARYHVDLLVTDGAPLGSGPAFDVVLQEAAARRIPLHAAQAGEVIDLGDGVRLEVIHPAPTAAEPPEPGSNDNSVAVRIVYGAFTALLTGDAEVAGERALVDSGFPLAAMVYKAGHHGAATSSNRFLLEAVQPRIAVISAGADNRFGHPDPALLTRLHDHGVTVVSTIDHGTQFFTTDGRYLWWRAAGKR